MERIIFSLLVLLQFSACSSQSRFEEFIHDFEIISLPIEHMQDITTEDTLGGKLINDIIIRSQKNNPQYVDINGNTKAVKQYYGLYPEEPFEYGHRGKRLYFYPKISPIGQLDLNEDYISLIIKVVGFETTFYDLWNFSKDGKALSVICLFWGLRDDGPKSEEVTYTIVDSKITKEGLIKWHENADGLETFRTYKLNEDGYFEIIKEEQKGEYEF
ncbi:hypothetical protein [Anaerophaga thermohalophila]|uniref:hypothetical protein n=1 Tax=Anaerophaga thermohalophila TaxID=177400 RepID=UPI000237CE60|nr:hypothetical protein [Anaerophaga thermohalophila]